MLVYVLDINGNSLMPTRPARARRMLKQKRAKVVSKISKKVFTIQLLYEPKTHVVEKCKHGMDTGSSYIGSAVVDEHNNVLYASNIEVRNDIKPEMDQRRKYRRTRRNRKTRYRKPRFKNRKNSTKTGRFSPTMISKLNAHKKEIEFVKSILPIDEVIIETGKFDVALLKDPTLAEEKWKYQKGEKYGFSNVREFIKDRDEYTCQYCGKKHVRLDVHHIIFRSKGGSDDPENLITLCHECHIKLHHGEIKLKNKGKEKSNLNHATQMNSIRVQLKKAYPEATETQGYITNQNRLDLNLPKDHYMDAVVIATNGEKPNFKTDTVILKKCVAKGDYQLYKGKHSEKKIPTGKVHGFKKFDTVRYLGKEYFVKGRLSSGYLILMDISGKKIDFTEEAKKYGIGKTVKADKCKRLAGRRTWIISTKPIKKHI